MAWSGYEILQGGKYYTAKILQVAKKLVEGCPTILQNFHNDLGHCEIEQGVFECTAKILQPPMVSAN